MSKLTIGEIEAMVHEPFKNKQPEEIAAQNLFYAGVTEKEMCDKAREIGGTCLPDRQWITTMNALRDIEKGIAVIDQKAKEISEKARPKCEKCGCQNDDVEKMVNPYLHDMFDDNTKEYLCQDCYHDLREST